MGDADGAVARVNGKDGHSLAGVKRKPSSAAKTESIGDGDRRKHEAADKYSTRGLRHRSHTGVWPKVAIALSNPIPLSEVTKSDEGRVSRVRKRVSSDEGTEQEKTEITERNVF